MASLRRYDGKGMTLIIEDREFFGRINRRVNPVNGHNEYSFIMEETGQEIFISGHGEYDLHPSCRVRIFKNGDKTKMFHSGKLNQVLEASGSWQ